MHIPLDFEYITTLSIDKFETKQGDGHSLCMSNNALCVWLSSNYRTGVFAPKMVVGVCPKFHDTLTRHLSGPHISTIVKMQQAHETYGVLAANFTTQAFCDLFGRKKDLSTSESKAELAGWAWWQVSTSLSNEHAWLISNVLRTNL